MVEYTFYFKENQRGKFDEPLIHVSLLPGEYFRNKKPAPKGNGLIVVEDFAVIICYFYLYAGYPLPNY